MNALGRLAVIAVVTAALGGCARETETAAEPPPAPASTATLAEPEDLTATDVETTIPIGGPSFVTAVRVGSSVNATGTLQTETERFAAGDPIVVILELRESPPGAAARVVIRNGEKVLVEQRMEIPEGAPRVSFTITGTEALPRGELTLEAFMGGRLEAERTVAIADRQ